MQLTARFALKICLVLKHTLPSTTEKLSRENERERGRESAQSVGKPNNLCAPHHMHDEGTRATRKTLRIYYFIYGWWCEPRPRAQWHSRRVESRIVLVAFYLGHHLLVDLACRRTSALDFPYIAITLLLYDAAAWYLCAKCVCDFNVHAGRI